MSDWQTLTLVDVCSVITDGAHQSPKTVASGKPMASVKDLTRFGVDLSDARHIAPEDFENLVKQGCQPQVGDVLIAKDGNSALDTVCTVDKPLDAVLLSSVAILRPNPGVLDSNFLKFYLCSPDTVAYLKSNFISGAAIPRVVLRDFKRAEIFLPNLEAQKRISAVLQTIDDKIDLNRRINQTLEAMAQAIFKSWFVDFDPVKAKIAAIEQGQDPLHAAMRAISGKTDAELDQMPRHQYDQLAATAALFPDAMEESELGEIPKGWAAGKIGDLAEVTIGGDWGKDQPGDGQYVQAVCLRGVDLQHLRDTGECPKAPVRWVKKNSIGKRQIQNVDLLIGGSGAGPCGRPLYASPLIAELVDYPVIYSNFVKRFRCKHSSQAVYLDRILWGMFNGGEMQHYINGTSVPNLNDRGLIAHPIVLPECQLLKEFEKISQLWLRKLYFGESKTLSELRDILLPKLLSGELRVPDVENIAEEV